jgi:hypothetical protein
MIFFGRGHQVYEIVFANLSLSIGRKHNPEEDVSPFAFIQ